MSGADIDVVIHGATPAFVCGTVDRIFIVRWVGTVTREAMGEVFDCMLNARRRVGAPLVTVSIVPHGLDGPPHKSTPRTDAHFEIVDHVTEALYAVFEGEGVQPKIMRGLVALRALTMRIEILPCVSTAEAMDRAARHVNHDPAMLIERARAAGLLT